ncbi:MAG: hypothetical protein ACRCU3_08430 [Eubacteriaceae bacterium]
MKTPICYPGAKNRIAYWVIDKMPENHLSYVDCKYANHMPLGPTWEYATIINNIIDEPKCFVL